MIARGASTRQVAQRLFITPKTAETHIERIYAKTGASTRSTATLFAMQHGLLDTLSRSKRRGNPGRRRAARRVAFALEAPTRGSAPPWPARQSSA